MKRFTTFLCKPFSRLLMVLMVVGFCSATAKAVDFGEMQLGVDYACPYQSWTGTFVAPSTGTLTIAGSMNVGVYTDPAYTMASSLELSFVSYGPYTQSCEVEKGTTYYLRDAMGWDAGPVRLSMEGVGEEPLELIDCTPAEGGYYDLSSDLGANLQLMFNQAVQVTSRFRIVVSSGANAGNSTSAGGALANSKFISAPVQEVVIRMLDQGLIVPNEKFKVVFTGLKTASGQTLASNYNEADGTTTFEFICPEKPVSFVSSVLPETFLSYWIPGNPEAKIEFVFDGELGAGENTNLQLQYGDPEVDNGYYVENVPYVINDNKITADLAGTLRTPATMLPILGTEYKQMTIRLGSVIDATGNYVKSLSSGMLGSFAWTLPYKQLERATVAAEFLPANGGTIKGLTSIELWLNSLNILEFNGFKFAYNDENGQEVSTVVPLSSCTFVSDGDNEGTYTIPVPAGYADQKGVTITLDDLLSADGYDHSEDVKAIYNQDFVITFADPANGSQFAVLESGTVITIETNCGAAYPEMYVIYEIEDLNPEDPDQAIIKTESWMNRQDDGTYQAEVFGNYKMMANHQYKVTFSAWKSEADKNYKTEDGFLGTDFLIWEGLTMPYLYSSIELVKITPDTDTRLSSDDRVFVLDFDGYVNLEASTTFINVGQGMTQAFESIVPTNPQTSDDGVSYSDQWTLTVPVSYMNSLTNALDLSIKAYDQDGQLVKGNEGTEENTYFYFSYDVEARYKDYEVSLPDNATSAYSVAELIASASEGINASGWVAVNTAYVMTKADQEIVAYVKDVIGTLEVEGGSDDQNTSVRVVLDTEITTPGAYVAYFPENYFNLGSEFNQFNSAEKFFSFIVEEKPEPIELDITYSPALGEVESLSTLELTFNGYDEVALGSGIVSLYRNKQLLETFDMDLDWDVWNKVIINLSQTYTEPGEYTFFVPEGYITLGAAGVSAPAFTFSYTIAEKPEPVELEITTDPAEGVVESLSIINLTVENYDMVAIGAGQIQVYLNKQLLKAVDAEYDWSADNKLTIDLGETYTEAGVYTLFIPEGYLLVGDNGLEAPAYTLTYTVEEQAIPEFGFTADPAEGKVTSLRFINLVFDEFSEVGIGAGFAKLYIDNDLMSYHDATLDDVELNKATIDLFKEYTEPGVYRIDFPEGYFILGAKGEVISPAFSLEYTIPAASGIRGITLDANGQLKVYDLNGVLVVDGDLEAVKGLSSGVYIVNGVKVLVK